MAVRLRQLVLATDHLDAVTDRLCTVFGVDYAYHDPGVGKYGLRNSVVPLGDTFLEAVSPVEPDTAASRFLARRGGDGGYMVILQVEDAAKARERIAGAGARIVDQVDLPQATFTHIHPKDVGGAILSLDTMTPPGHWEWGGPEWEQRPREEEPLGIVRAEIADRDPARLAARWAEVIGVPVRQDGFDRWTMPLDGGAIHFVAQGDGADGLVALDVAIGDPSRATDGVEVGGVRMRLVAR